MVKQGQDFSLIHMWYEQEYFYKAFYQYLSFLSQYVLEGRDTV